MAKDPSVSFYTSDFLSGTAFFTDEQRGQYILLLCQQHQLGSIPRNHMISVCGSDDSPVIKKFKVDDKGNYYNERMKIEHEKRVKYCESRSNNRSGRKPRKSYVESYDSKVIRHMENENENENENELENNRKLGAAEFLYLADKEFNEAFEHYLEMRKKIRKPATEKAKEMVLKELHKQPIAIAIKILEQSVFNSWQGIFPLKANQSTNKMPPKFGE